MACACIDSLQTAAPIDKAILFAFVVALFGGCGASDDAFAKVVVGTWGSREVAPDDVIVETQFTLLPGGRVNWQGELRMLVPPTFICRTARTAKSGMAGWCITFRRAATGWCVMVTCTPGSNPRPCQSDAGGFRRGLASQGSHQQGDDLPVRGRRPDACGSSQTVSVDVTAARTPQRLRAAPWLPPRTPRSADPS